MAKQSSKKSKAKKEAHAKTPKKSGRRYGLNKAKTEYVSKNDDLQDRRVTTPTEDDLVNVE
ncbi:hypothetical protein H5410_058167 [Solanum commersonii]|uniref:Uncharacterized protein n=1 Tax=Solanum commersonii TaxID=4109 RepID=A0A9J5WQ94_SOLCO|nr:hypothetical protein H5410_058167 [Solanum commersonii]